MAEKTTYRTTDEALRTLKRCRRAETAERWKSSRIAGVVGVAVVCGGGVGGGVVCGGVGGVEETG